MKTIKGELKKYKAHLTWSVDAWVDVEARDPDHVLDLVGDANLPEGDFIPGSFSCEEIEEV